MLETHTARFRPRESRTFSFLYAHRRSPPASELEEDCEVEVASGHSITDQMRMSGILKSPVGTQAQVNREDLRTIESWLFMIPPSAVRAQPAGSSAKGTDSEGQYGSSVREE
jgi:hypothetical protein